MVENIDVQLSLNLTSTGLLVYNPEIWSEYNVQLSSQTTPAQVLLHLI